ncbi:MAG: valine--tRNA ligase [Phycisphaerae bacterium]
MAKSGSKSYNPAETERRIFEFWLRRGCFHPQPDDRGRDRRFSMVIPPPNVTGALHLGHALNNTLQDILIRRKRMQGCNTFWLVGTDHAGIATQATVEKTIRKEEGKSRHDLGRDELVRRIWEWKERFGGRIVKQLRLMGCSCDYERERFTLDEGCARAVRHTFFKLFRDGLIYRGKRMVNWDTQLQTAVADDEVYHETVKGHFWHIRYPIAGEPPPPAVGANRSAHGGEHRRPAGANEIAAETRTGGTPMLPDDAQFGRDYVLIATTRPETMLADTAVAVHPDPAAALDHVEAELKQKLADAADKDQADLQAALDDLTERRRTLLPTLLRLRDMARDGRTVTLPLVNRTIPLICDEWARPELGSGCVKITPAHDPNDYDVGRRHDLPLVNVLTEDGRIARIVEPDGQVNPHSERYEGLRFATKGRDTVVADLDALGLVEKIDDRMIEIGHSDRSKAPIEPYLSDQWFVRMGDLTAAQAARVQSPLLKRYFKEKQEPRASEEPHRPNTEEALLASEEPRASARAALEDQHGHASAAVTPTVPGLAQMAIDAVEHGDVRFHPPRYKKTYIDWLSEKRDWCISRQLWWGHRIPVWRKTRIVPDSELSDIESLAGRIGVWLKAGRIAEGWRPPTDNESHDARFPFHFLCVRDQDDREAIDAIEKNGLFVQDPDVLDTWFSSALWPHSTLGWPDGNDTADERQASACAAAPSEKSSLLDYFYPTSILSTAREIITLWVARMVMTGLYNMGDVPFTDVVIHPVIQDAQGRKMSKTLGNGVDPVDIIDEYGADALRFTLADLATETQDIRMPVQTKKLPDGRAINFSPRFEKGRNFCNKLWQAATGFVLRNLGDYAPTSLDPAALALEDRWILSRLTNCLARVNRAVDSYRFSDAINAAYHFMWDDYCSWYIEMTKLRLAPPASGQPRSEERGPVQQVLVVVLDQLLRVLHPFVPFVTETLWAELNKLAPRRGLRNTARSEPTLIEAAWPEVDAGLRDEAIEAEMATFQDAIRGIRDILALVNTYRGRQKQPAIRRLPRVVIRTDGACVRRFESHRSFIMLLAGCDSLEIVTRIDRPPGAMSRACGPIEVLAPVAHLIDLADVRQSESSKLADVRTALERAERQLANENFVRRADPAVVERARERAADLERQVQLIEQSLSDME